MKLLILVHHRFDLWNVPSWFTEKLAAEFRDVEVVCLNTYEGAEEHLRNVEIVFTISLRPEQFALARQLQWVHAPTAAVHQLLFAELGGRRFAEPGFGQGRRLALGWQKRFHRRSSFSRSEFGGRRPSGTKALVRVRLPVRQWD